MIPRGTVRLIGTLALLVHDDQSQILHRCKNGTSGADDDLHRTGSDAPPRFAPLPQGQLTVDHRHDIAEQLIELFHDLGRKSDFRHQQNHLLSTLHHGVDQPDKHAGLAAAGDAVQQKAVHALAQCSDHAVIYCLLFRGQHDVCGLASLTAGGICVQRRLHRIGFHHAILHQLFRHRCSHAAEIARLFF